jgi:hypothetical protein
MENIGIFCCRSCLRGDDNKEYYEILSIKQNDNTDTIKKSYKKASLNLHPDKLAQKGIQQTQQHKDDFLKVKVAYEVLSDPKRRKLYDQLGESGMKLIESPRDVNPLDLIRKFQSNSNDRLKLVLILILLFSLITFPFVLFSLKCDGNLSASWMEMWIPMFVIDGLLLIQAGYLCTLSSVDKEEEKRKENNNLTDDDDNEENNEDSYEIPVPLSLKVYNFLSTISFILAQVFILLRFDNEIDWDYFIVFIPWYAYEIINITALIPTCLEKLDLPPAVDSTTLESGENHDAIEAILKIENEYFEKLFNKCKDISTVVVSILRLWFALFLAIQFNNDEWNWGVVMLPIWFYLFWLCIYAYYLKQTAADYMSGIDVSSVSSPEELDPLEQTKLQLGLSMSSSAAFERIFFVMVLLTSTLLVSRLEVNPNISTFWIIIPVFTIIVICCCGVFGSIACLSNIDADGLDEEFNPKDGDNEGNKGTVKEMGSKSYIPPEINAATSNIVVNTVDINLEVDKPSQSNEKVNHIDSDID